MSGKFIAVFTLPRLLYFRQLNPRRHRRKLPLLCGFAPNAGRDRATGLSRWRSEDAGG